MFDEMKKLNLQNFLVATTHCMQNYEISFVSCAQTNQLLCCGQRKRIKSCMRKFPFLFSCLLFLFVYFERKIYENSYNLKCL